MVKDKERRNMERDALCLVPESACWEIVTKVVPVSSFLGASAGKQRIWLSGMLKSSSLETSFSQKCLIKMLPLS